MGSYLNSLQYIIFFYYFKIEFSNLKKNIVTTNERKPNYIDGFYCNF